MGKLICRVEGRAKVSRSFDNKLICLKYFCAMYALDFEHRVEQAREGTEGACMRDGVRALLADWPAQRNTRSLDSFRRASASSSSLGMTGDYEEATSSELRC